MKRLLQVASVVLVGVAVMLGLRIVRVLQVSLPELGEPSQVASATPLQPLPRSSSPRGAARDAIVTGNLFETERGYKEVDDLAADQSDEPPLPPPTNIVLNGVFVSRDRPMVILTDSSSGNRQVTLHVGDNVGDYQVGKITERRVTLIGRGNQEFLLELAIKKGGAAPLRNVAAARGARPASAASRPGQPRTTPTAAQRAQAARERAAAARERAQQARTQTPAQRAAAARAAARTQADKRAQGGGAVDRIDPTQARLEALKRLREAAAKR